VTRVQPAFIRQSSASNYCAVYATAMLASAAGVAMDRRRALREFGLSRTNPHYRGASLSKVIDVFRRTVRPRVARWIFWRKVDVAVLASAARVQIANTGAPALVSFRAVHRRRGFECTHATLIVEADSRLRLLDPLGRRPADDQGWNAEVAPEPDASGKLEARGTCYAIDVHGPASLLQWNDMETSDP
jgi:hypothetical protein